MVKKARFAFRPTLVSLAVASCFATGAVQANPTGHQVVRGTADIHRVGNLLQITNSPNAIINWQSFSIGANEITRFIQQSNSSAVLNRVTTQNPSQILGALQSRLTNGTTGGKVFLINPNGIVFGKGATIDVGGLVASTLRLSDEDFLAGRQRYTEGLGKALVNQGSITTSAGGSVYLVGSSVTNDGIIRSPQGEVVLAAGKSVELVSPGTPNLRVEVVAEDNAARNLGQIVADAGRIGIYAGLVTQSGTVRADGAVAEGGRIVLKATKSATLEAGSVTSANGTTGGSVAVQSGDTTLVSGSVEVVGSEGQGGTVQLLGNLVGLTGNARVDASGEAGGGTVLVGGDFQGKNPDIQNAYRTYLGPDAQIRADAVTSGDGGKVIVWSDDSTRAYGTISARGGAESGNGGFVEVSGKRYLDYQARTIANAPKGKAGTLLLDPSNITIDNGPDSPGGFDGDPYYLFDSADEARISWATIKGHLTPGLNVDISTSRGSGPTAVGNITIAADSPDLASDGYLRLHADQKIFVNARITNSNTAGTLLLESGAGVEQNASGAITYGKLYVDGGGGNVLLNAANNRVGVIAGRAGQRFLFKNAQSLEIGSISVPALAFGASGINVSNCCDPGVIDVNVTSGNLSVTSNVGISTLSSAKITLSGGNISINGAFVTADGAEGASVSLNASGNVSLGGTVYADACCFNDAAGASVGITAGGNITIDGSEGNAFGGSGGGNATMNLTAGGAISVRNSTLDVSGGGGGNAGGKADLTLTAGGGITINNATLEASGGEGFTTGGNANVFLTANGGPILVQDSARTISAFGGVSTGTGGNALVSMTANGDITIDGSRLLADGYGDAISTNIGGNGTVTLNPMSGEVKLLNGSTVEVTGGAGRTTSGSGLINMLFSGRTTGGWSYDGEEGALTGFLVNGQEGVLGTNVIVVYSNDVLFVDPLVAAMNTQVDVLADQLKAGETGEGGEDKEKKKLPFCDG